jgi:intracellular multiplication protein IcmE
MAIKFPGLKIFTAADAKTRVFLVFAAISALSLIIFLMVRYFGGGGAAAPTRLATAPSSLQTVPGSQMTPEFYRAVVKANTQAAQQAQISGGSAVPTLIRSPDDSGFPSQDCTILCPGDDAANVADDIAKLNKQGVLSDDEANHLLDLAKRNVSVEEYAAALDELVKQGKLTPEQARALLEKYRKQHANALAAESAQTMDGMIKSNELPLDVANYLLGLQKKNLTPEEYAAELNRLVREGKISAATAAKLLAQYTQQKMREQAKDSAYGLQQMAKAGEITADVAKSLADLQNRGASADEYEAELNRLVAAGKMTPAAAAKLLAQYKKQRAGYGPAAILSSLLGPQASQAARDQVQRLIDLQANNASESEYADELKKAVQAGIITPEMAADLMAQYRALKAPVPVGAAPGVEANIPGAAAFSQLQQAVQAEATPPAEQPAEFAEARTESKGETDQQLSQRVEQLQAAMAGQAQNLINAWQPAVMTHKEGEKSKDEDNQSKDGKSKESKSKDDKSSKEAQALKPALLKAGTILFAVLDTAVDSDYPDTPVMATIIQGKLKGTKLLGKLQLAKSPTPGQFPDRVSLNFTLMDKDDWLTSKTISAFAIDPDTARTVMASNVDYHYLKRFGATMAASFLQGYASAISSSGSTTTNGIFGPTTTNPQLSPASKFAVGLGQIGTTLGTQVAGYVNIPPTVKVNSGVGLGILFMSEVKE